MNDTDTRLMQIEEKIAALRQEVNSISADCVSVSDDLDKLTQYRHRIAFIEADIESLHRQAILLRNFVNGRENNARVQRRVSYKPIEVKPAKEERVTSTKDRNYEKLFGKGFMGVFAAILIFISFCIFATLILPMLNDNLKVILMYEVSAAITAAGMIIHQRKPENKFYLVLLSVGTGALYISLLLSSVYFKIIDNIVLYILIIVWACFIRYLTKYKNVLFSIIGYLGIFISTILGTILCVSTQDITMLFALTLFYIICQFIFSNAHPSVASSIKLTRFINYKTIQGSYTYGLAMHINKILNSFVLCLGYAFIDKSIMSMIGLLILIVHLIIDYLSALSEDVNTDIECFLFNIISSIDLLLVVSLFYNTHTVDTVMMCLVAYLLSAAMLASIEIKRVYTSVVIKITCFVLMNVMCLITSVLRLHFYIIGTVVLFAIYGKISKSKSYQLMSCASMLLTSLFVYSTSYINYTEHMIFLIVACVVLLFVLHDNEFVSVRSFGYISMLITISVFFSYFIGEYNSVVLSNVESGLLVFYIVAVFHLAIMYSKLLGTDDYINKVLYVVNASLMASGCFMIQFESLRIVTIIITLLLFILNTKNVMEQNQKYGYYVDSKLTVLMLSILIAYALQGFVISICLLVFAIASISIGFYKRIDSFRFYGLILSFIGVLKLLIFDIQYDSLFKGALGLFIGGVLCLVICFIYYKVDNQLKNS